MNRYIEILDDSHQLQQFSAEELPLEINAFIENDSTKKETEQLKYILIETINKKNNTVEAINGLEKQTCAYIARDEDYLFLQANTENNKDSGIKIFHNNEIIEKSVWLKSGDKIQINNKIIHYEVNGDIIKISVHDKPEATKIINKEVILTPPLSKASSPVTSDTLNHTKDPVHKTEINIDNRTKKSFIIISSFILMILLIFVLLSQTVQLSIKPEPDKIQLSGILPVIKLAGQYILISGEYKLLAEKKDYKTINESLLIDSANNKFIYTMQEQPGLISFDINPDKNNTLYIDNKLLGEYINTRELEIDRGEHNIYVSNQRYKPFEEKIQVQGKNKYQKFSFTLKPNWGQLKIISDTENVSIQIISDNNKAIIYNDRLIETNELELISGEYILIVTKEKYKGHSQKFSINASETKKIQLSALEPEDATIKLTSEPMGAYIRVDKKYMGKTPQTISVSANKEHEIEVSLSGYKILKKKLTLQPEEISEQNYKLNTLKGIIFISVSPAHARLYIDGQQQQRTSGKFDIGGNNHLLIVKAKGYKTQRKKINASHQSKNISFNLQKKNKIKSGKDKKIASINSNYTNKISQKMLLMKPASFMMGSKKNEAGRGSNEGEYRVKLDYSYYLSEKEITNKQFRRFKASHNSGLTSGQSIARGAQPVVNISWNEAAEFANWLSKKEGLKAYYKKLNGKLVPVDLTAKINGYRLPFEAEWALAARGLNRKKYPWSGGFPPVTVSGNFADESARNYVANIIEGYNDNHGVSAPVGSYKNNAAGFYDLGGNVSEWCQDYYSPYSGFSANKIKSNPTGPLKGTHKVVRDSSWRDASITELRLAYRSYSKKKAKDIGFRLARYAQ